MTESPRTILAAEIRKLNARISELDPERQREIQADWLASWNQLARQREAAVDDAADLAAVEDWAAHWTDRLSLADESSLT